MLKSAFRPLPAAACEIVPVATEFMTKVTAPYCRRPSLIANTHAGFRPEAVPGGVARSMSPQPGSPRPRCASAGAWFSSGSGPTAGTRWSACPRHPVGEQTLQVGPEGNSRPA